MFETVARVLIFFSLIGLGALLVKTKRLTAHGLDGLSAYFYWLGFPAFLLSYFSQMTRPDIHLSLMILTYAGAMMVCAGLSVITLTALRAQRSEAIGAGMASFINNSAFLGIPIATSLFGQAAGQIGALIVAVDFLLLFCLGCAALAWSSGHKIRAALKRTAMNPTIIASAVGLILMLFHVRFPPVFQTGLDMLGRSGPPVALVALGGMLAMMPAKTLFGFEKSSAVAVAAKILVAPAVVALALWAVNAEPLIFKTGVLLAATPTAVSVFIQTKIYGTWYENAAIAISQSTAISLFTLSAIALILTH